MIVECLKPFIFLLLLLGFIGQCRLEQDHDMKHRYTQMFKEKRIEQQEAVTRLTKMKQQQRISIIQEMLNKMFEVLSSSLNNLSSMKIEAKKIELDQYNNTVSSLEVLDNISSVLENTAFLCDLGLYFTPRFRSIYEKNPEWIAILKSAIDFTLNSGLIDDETLKNIILMEQEIDLKPKDVNFVNPYHPIERAKQNEIELNQSMSKKQRERHKRGPGLSGSHKKTEL